METAIRVIIVYAVILVGLRIVGKREFSELTPMDFIVLLLIPELVSQALLGEDFSMTNALIGVGTLLSIVLLVSWVSYLSHRAQRFMEGSPAVLVEHGALVVTAMARERITPDEVYSQIRRSGLESLDQVKWAILESDGKISVIPERQIPLPVNPPEPPSHST